MTNSAKKALSNAGSSREGVKVKADPATLAELRDRGLIGRDGGLTRRGAIERERAESADLDALFG